MVSKFKKSVAVMAMAATLASGSAVAMAAETGDASTAQAQELRDHRRPRVRRTLMTVVTETLGVNRGQVISTIRSGGTLAGLAEEQGVDPAALIGNLVAVVDGWLDQAVANGRITAAEAAEKLAKATERITNFVNTPHQPGRRPGQ
jgi:hypothetical protein